MSNAVLIRGDCLEVMKAIPDSSVDMILTDPPYGINFKSNRRKDKYRNIANDNLLHWLDDFVEQAFRVSSENSVHYFFLLISLY